jgi:hypothetical protein
MMMKGPTREVYPSGPVELSVALPPGRRAGHARLLVAEEDAAIREEDGRVVVAVPGIEMAELVHIAWRRG